MWLYVMGTLAVLLAVGSPLVFLFAWLERRAYAARYGPRALALLDARLAGMDLELRRAEGRAAVDGG